MNRCLVVFYSWTGHTGKVARGLAEKLSADLEEIREVRPRGGLFAFLRSGMEASRKQSAPVLRSSRNLADYDLIILGSPVWAASMASPVRGFIEQERGAIRDVALFCTLSGSGGEAALGAMAELCGRPPVATLQVTAGALKSGSWRDEVDRFAGRLIAAMRPVAA